MKGISINEKKYKGRKLYKRYLKGSYTVEAAVVLPFTMAFWVAILFFLQVLQIETAVQESLIYAGRKTAVEACTVESDAALLASAEVLFRTELGRYSLAEQVIRGKKAGITLLDSDMDGDTLQLRAEYTVRLPFDFFHVAGIRIIQNSNNHKWTGRTVAGSDDDGGDDDEYVYVTDNGSVYHTTDCCGYLKLSIKTTTVSNISSLRNSSGAIYYPCSCCKASSASQTVYYTTYGTNYHTSLTCSGLKRTTHKVKKSEVEGMRACSKCGGE